MGVITVTDIDYGQIFGPFPSYLISTDPACVIGLLTNDKQPEGVVLRVDTSEKRERARSVDWLPYVSSARDEEEQNMEAYLKERCIFYRTLRIVKAGEELLVWYSKDFTQILGVPELQTNSKRDDEQFICSHCGEMFDFPYPLRAHLKFKCSFTCEDNLLSVQSNSLHSPPILSSSQIHRYIQRHDRKDKAQSNHQSLDLSDNISKKNSNNNTVFPIGFRKRLVNGSDTDAPPNKFPAISNKSPKDETAISHSIEKLSKSHIPKEESKNNCDNGLEVHSENVSAFRKVEKSPTSSDLRVSSPADLRSAHKALPSKSMQQQLSPPYSVMTTSSLMENQRLLGLHPPPPSLLTQSTSSSSIDEPSTSSIMKQSTSPIKAMSSAAATPRSEPALAAPALMGMYIPRIPAMLHQPTPLGIPRPGFLSSPMSATSGRSLPVPHSAFPDQIPPGLLEMCRATIPTVGPLTESFAANIRKMDIHDTLSKQALFADRHISSLGFLKSSNPMVEKLLQTTNPTLLSSPINALNLSQNWCAKCNATFRMTSDLVYHMRSHHKREFDPMKRKREEKLKCNICNETFRERHHLTRHMSSHA